MNTRYFIADYHHSEHAEAVVALLDMYARDPMGGAAPLSDNTKDNLIDRLIEVPGAFSVLALGETGYIGLANCFTGFSTFNCKPLINIHDLVVASNTRGQGVGQGLLACVEQQAQQLGCCKITLEVLEGNTIARNAYTKFGFESYTLDDETGAALFLQKSLPVS